jgi:3-hydroxyisobutyrate dehydrogenase-like beta-hydroxyacid dehydrogenase
MSASTKKVAVIGTGAIGSAVVRRLRDEGCDVVVWNRTAGRADGLGVRVAARIQDAAVHGELILLTVSDHAAVRQCLAALAPDQLAGRTLIAMCTGTPDEARAAARRVAELGGRYLDAGLQTGPDLDGIILYGGDRAVFYQHQATLALLGTPRFAGAEPAAAAVWDLALFGLWYDAQLGLLRALDAVRESGTDLREFAETAAAQLAHVVTAAGPTADEMVHGVYPAGPADLGEHRTLVGRLREFRAGRQLGDGGLTEVAARIDRLVTAGRGTEGLTATVAPPG